MGKFYARSPFQSSNELDALLQSRQGDRPPKTPLNQPNKESTGVFQRAFQALTLRITWSENCDFL